MVALFPVSWKPIPYYLHMTGVILAGASMLSTVVIDGLLTKTRDSRHAIAGRFFRFISFALIVCGGILTLGSAEPFNWYKVSLLGESMLIAGYFVWISVKTYQGEGNRTVLSRILKRVVLID
jgi:hypothetical protein